MLKIVNALQILISLPLTGIVLPILTKTLLLTLEIVPNMYTVSISIRESVFSANLVTTSNKVEMEYLPNV